MNVIYLTRNLPVELRDRLRVLATLGVHDLRTMEAVVNEALEIGVAVLEKEQRLAPRADA